MRNWCICWYNKLHSYEKVWLSSQLREKSTKVVEPVRVRAGLIMLLNELEVMGCLVYDHSRILPAAVNDVTQAIPWVLLHKKLGGDVFHFHNLCAVRDVIYCGHSDSCKTEHRNDPSATHSKHIWFNGLI